MRQVGERVGAIVSAIPDTVTMFGYGVYVGDEIPPPGYAQHAEYRKRGGKTS